MVNAQPAADAPEEQQGGGWYKTIFNAIMVYFAINAATQLLGGKLGGQKDAVTGPDGSVKPRGATQAAEPVPALWSLGTKMVFHLESLK